MDKVVILTGINGGIGRAICTDLQKEGYKILGIDQQASCNLECQYIQLDLEKLAVSSKEREDLELKLKSVLQGKLLKGLVNNAAVQIIGGVDDLALEDFAKTLNVNVVAPFALSKICLPHLENSKGNIINIGSIHSYLTKEKFVGYATSKGAIETLTKAMAVDIGSRVQINGVQPGAVATDMLLDGFKDNPEALSKLKFYHPTHDIAAPHEIAATIVFLLSGKCPFMNGSIVQINGGIGSRLHDPC